MWSIVEPASGKTNVVTVPADGIISIVKPKGVGISAVVNNADMPLAHMHVKAGDSVYFCLTGAKSAKKVAFEYGGVTSYIEVPACPDEPAADDESTATTTEEDNMTSVVGTPGGDVNYFAHPGMGYGYGGYNNGGYNNGGAVGGAIGGGLGAGLLGGVLGGALLGGNNRGGLFGGNNNGGGDGFAAINTINQNTDARVASATALNEARFNAEAQFGLLGAIERTAAATQLAQQVSSAALGVEVQKTSGELNTQAALNASILGVQAQKNAGDLSTQMALTGAGTNAQIAIIGTAAALAAKDAALQSAAQTYALSTAIKTDGDQTRALIVAQNDAMLNRIITTQANEIIELKGDRRSFGIQRESEINVTQTVNQAQAQAQQQQQQQQILFTLGQIVPLLGNLQSAVATNSNLIVGNTGATTTGAQTANPVNVKG